MSLGQDCTALSDESVSNKMDILITALTIILGKYCDFLVTNCFSSFGLRDNKE